MEKVASYYCWAEEKEKVALSQEGKEIWAEVAILQMGLCRWEQPDTMGDRVIGDSSIKEEGMVIESIITATTTMPLGIPYALMWQPFSHNA